MIFNNFFGVLALSAGFIDGALTLSPKLLRNRDSIGLEGPSLVPRQDTTATCLAAKSIATASFLDGQGKGANGLAPGQSRSETDKVNFIHVCDGKTLTNGLQSKDGSCNPIPMGDIPSIDNMVTTIITSPGQGDDLEANKDFDIKLQVNNLNAGSFTNPQVTYYAAPQRLKNGKIIGHVHVTVQDLKGSLTPNTPPDPTTFVHFKGIDDDGNGKGELKNTVTGGLPPGFYRICTLSAASNHQPVIMPVAQRGAQDDCIRVTVGQGTGANNAGGNKKGDNAGANNQGGNAQGGNNQGGNNQGGNNQGGNNQEGNNQGGNNQGGNGNNQGGNNQGGQNKGGNAQGDNAQGGSNQEANAGGKNNGANSDGKGSGGDTAGKSEGANASGNSNGGDNKDGAASNGNNNAGNPDGKNDGGKPDGKNGGSKSDGNNNSNSNGSPNGSNDGSNNVTKSADDKKAAKPTDGVKPADGNNVIKSDGNKDIAGESKKATKSHKIDNASDEPGDSGNGGTKTDKTNKAATTSTPGSTKQLPARGEKREEIRKWQ